MWSDVEIALFSEDDDPIQANHAFSESDQFRLGVPITGLIRESDQIHRRPLFTLSRFSFVWLRQADATEGVREVLGEMFAIWGKEPSTPLTALAKRSDQVEANRV